MKKVLLIAVIALFAFSSCEKSGIILLEKAPELKGEWVWTHTYVGGVVGFVHADDNKPLVIDFKGNNIISVMYDGETIVRNASYTCEEATDSPYGNHPYGKYLIKLPKEVRSTVAEKMGVPESCIVVDGYLSIDDAVDLSEPNLTLYITDVESHDAGVEGGSDFHCTSGFKQNRIVLH